jgi:hypothetical protein
MGEKRKGSCGISELLVRLETHSTVLQTFPLLVEPPDGREHIRPHTREIAKSPWYGKQGSPRFFSCRLMKMLFPRVLLMKIEVVKED